MSIILNSTNKEDAEFRSTVLSTVEPQLWRYIQRHGQVVEANLKVEPTALPPTDIHRLGAVHFLLDPSIARFVESVAPSLINRLNKQARLSTAVSHSAVRGRIRWPETLRLQVATGDRSQYVATTVHPQFDLPENQLLKHLLQRISALCKDVLSQYTTAGDGWLASVHTLRQVADSHLQGAAMRNISAISGVGPKHVWATRHAKHFEYRFLPGVATLLVRLADQADNYLREAVRQRYLEPMNLDVLYELFVLFSFMVQCEQAGWEVELQRLIGGHTGPVAVYRRHTKVLRVYYQRVPESLASVSRYKGVMAAHGVRRSLRTPDIIVEMVTAGGSPRYLLVEVKRSSDPGYIVDGIYKLFGYLRDYAIAIDRFDGTKGVLVAWQSPWKITRSEAEEVVVSDYIGLGGVFARLLAVWDQSWWWGDSTGTR